MDKPEACKGCPFYGDGKGYVPDEIRPSAKVALIAQNPGETEEYEARPLCGRTGKMVMNWLEPLGFKRADMTLANVIKCRVGGKNSLPMTRDGHFAPETLKAAEHCKRAHLNTTLKQSEANVTALLGELSLVTVAGREGITSWRGSVWEQAILGDTPRKLLALLHPAMLFRDMRFRTAMKQDFARIARESRGPKPAIAYDNCFHLAVGAEEFIATLDGMRAPRIALDIETSYAKAAEASLRTIGIGWSKQDAMNVDFSGLDTAERALVIAALSRFKGEIVTATPFDYAVLTRYGTQFNWPKCHDLTLLHSRYDIELPHTLEFIASMWTDRAFWKWMAATAPYYYNCLDCTGEWEAFSRLWTYCAVKDRRVLECYDRDRLLTKVAVAFMLNGLPFRPQSYEAEKAYYEFEREELQNEVAASFSTPTESEQPASSPRCERHPRYTGKSPVGKRKGDTHPCDVCGDVRRHYLSQQPLNLRSRLQLARKLKEVGIVVGKSMDKGSMAKLAKKYSDPRLMRYLEFKRKDTIVTRYFADPKVTRRTGRIHSTYSMHAAKHRWSSNGPNAQQFMRPEE